MPQTVLVWAEDEDRSALETGLAAVSDDQTYQSGDAHEIPADIPLIALAIAGTEFATYPLSEVRLAGVGMGGRGVNNWRINRGYAATFDPTTVLDFKEAPLVFDGIGGEMITGYSLEDDEAGVAHFNHLALILSDGPIPYRPHRITHIPKFSLAATGAAVTWKVDTPTLVDPLPAGRYNIWGAELMSATAIAARLKIPGLSRPPAFLPCRNEQDGLHPFNECIMGQGIPYLHKSGTFNIKMEYICEANETPGWAKLYLEYVGKI